MGRKNPGVREKGGNGMIRKLFWPVVLALTFSGCIVTESSLNVQRSALRGTGDTGATTMLENQNSEEVTEIVNGVVGICNDVLDFLKTGDVANLTKGELKITLLNVVPEESADFVSDILAFVSVSNYDVQRVGSRNVKRIRAFLNGVIDGASKYSVEDRD